MKRIMKEGYLTKNLVLKRIFFKILLTSRERGRKGEKKGEKHQCVVASGAPLTEDLARNPGMFS